MMKDIQQVKQEHELEWMQIPGVEGVGITQDGDTPSLILYITEKTAEIAVLPTEVDGFPLVLRQSGEFIAF